ncbi:hypothetical cytosolic protein [Syntrophus aciditrophicus SB]|uniref:Hypothetical cytosolic protein n=1 Tax=Syntrophus aciditrophicus (strain SB) TaxID=56780 RepID=Q2LU78_SYNAS|nr:hypothetical cytosolic protein [Syntrophus aciditrophicus SB]
MSRKYFSVPEEDFGRLSSVRESGRCLISRRHNSILFPNFIALYPSLPITSMSYFRNCPASDTIFYLKFIASEDAGRYNHS